MVEMTDCIVGNIYIITVFIYNAIQRIYLVINYQHFRVFTLNSFVILLKKRNSALRLKNKDFLTYYKDDESKIFDVCIGCCFCCNS